MKLYLTGTDAVHDLHNNGFTNDFQLFGTNLLWVQQGIFIRHDEFAIIEYRRVVSHKSGWKEMIVFGIIALNYNVKGILLDHYKSYTKQMPDILAKKIKEMCAGAKLTQIKN